MPGSNLKPEMRLLNLSATARVGRSEQIARLTWLRKVPPCAGQLMIKDLWYKNAVIYCLSVGTYMDANGDGIGDFQGLMRRLDYLHGLGITAIWLMPFQTLAGPGRRLRHL